MSTGPALEPFLTHFGSLPDPRVNRTRDHLLLDIVVLALCGLLCGADDWVAIAEFGRAKEAFFRQWLPLPHGIPSHDTLGRVFAALDPAAFEACFRAWVQDLVTQHAGQVVALDGKTLCGSADAPAGRRAIHMVSAWASANGAGLCLAQRAIDEKSNEISALPLLIAVLALRGCIVTIDAMGCQTAIAQAVVDQDGDYALALKANQNTPYEDTQRLFADADAAAWRGVAHERTETLNGGHGRVETRRYTLITDARYIGYVDPTGRWAGLRSLGRVEAERRVGGTVTTEVRYYLCSLTRVVDFARAARGHWGIENGLHWVLDVAFREDAQRARVGHSAENLAVLRHMALNLLKQEQTARCGTKAKRLKAGWDEQYLLKVLAAKPI
jgi:predicted transposase YbfD/YdcC